MTWFSTDIDAFPPEAVADANSKAERMRETFKQMPHDLESPVPIVHDLGRVTGATTVDPETFAALFPNLGELPTAKVIDQ